MNRIDLNQDADKAIKRIHSPIDSGEEDIIIDKDRDKKIVLEIIRSIINNCYSI